MGIESLPDRLINVLTYRRLVLDNFEQVVAAGPQLRDLLGACPGVTLLITSRLRLRLSGEREFPVSPLPLPLQVNPQLRLRMPGYPARFGSLPSGGREAYGPSPHSGGPGKIVLLVAE